MSLGEGTRDRSELGRPSGTITTGSGPIQAGFLGVRAHELDTTVRRGPAAVEVRGTGLALQVFADGVPQRSTTARVDIVGTHATTGFLGRRRAFVWTPRHLGSTYDMAIVRIRPGNAAAGGVHIGLKPMPPMFGGEPHALVGGNTSGLKGGDAIDSLIARNGDDAVQAHHRLRRPGGCPASPRAGGQLRSDSGERHHILTPGIVPVPAQGGKGERHIIASTFAIEGTGGQTPAAGP